MLNCPIPLPSFDLPGSSRAKVVQWGLSQTRKTFAPFLANSGIHWSKLNVPLSPPQQMFEPIGKKLLPSDVVKYFLSRLLTFTKPVEVISLPEGGVPVTVSSFENVVELRSLAVIESL